MGRWNKVDFGRSVGTGSTRTPGEVRGISYFVKEKLESGCKKEMFS